MSDPHVYIYLRDTREKCIVPVKCVKNLDYEVYKKNPKHFKNQTLKYKDPTTKSKHACGVLYMGGMKFKLYDIISLFLE